jgi:hypothetical protein
MYYMCETLTHMLRGKQIKDIWQQGAREVIWIKDGCCDRRQETVPS